MYYTCNFMVCIVDRPYTSSKMWDLHVFCPVDSLQLVNPPDGKRDVTLSQNTLRILMIPVEN